MLINVTPRRLLLSWFVSLLFFTLPAQATHILSSEITFHADTTNTSALRYFFKLVIYQETSLTTADSYRVQINFSDGTIKEVVRKSQTMLANHTNINRNVYYFDHLFPATGTFTVSLREINRAIDYLNIQKSENIALFIQTTVKIDLAAAGNNSPLFLAPFIPTGLVGQPYRHNVTAYDPDGDSLAYKLVPAMQNFNQPIASYKFPEGATINNRTGEFIWPAPEKTGRYGLAIEVREYRRGVLIGKVMRDFSVIILPAGQNPVLEIRNRNQIPINTRNQVFISSDAPVKIRVAATHAGSLEAYSELFQRNNVISAQVISDNPREIELTISPNAALKRSLPYILTFRGTSTTGNANGTVPQQDLTIAIYFRPERTTDQQDTNEPGELPVLTGIPATGDNPNGEVFKIFPNPANLWFRVNNSSKNPAVFLLYSPSSQLILTQNLKINQTLFYLGNRHKPGLYYYNIVAENGKMLQTGKLVIR